MTAHAPLLAPLRISLLDDHVHGHSMDCLARSFRDLHDIVKGLTERDVAFTFSKGTPKAHVAEDLGVLRTTL